MNNIGNIISVINENGGSATFNEIVNAYVKRWHILPIDENCHKIKSTLIKHEGKEIIYDNTSGIWSVNTIKNPLPSDNNNYSDRKFLEYSDIRHNLVIIKINKLYNPNMTSEELYEGTRGIWKRKIESVNNAEYALSVANGIVVEVYKIDGWYKAGTFPMKTRTINEERCKERIEFVGSIASDEVKSYYLGLNVSHLFKYGEANPVKYIPKSA